MVVALPRGTKRVIEALILRVQGARAAAPSLTLGNGSLGFNLFG